MFCGNVEPLKVGSLVKIKRRGTYLDEGTIGLIVRMCVKHSSNKNDLWEVEICGDQMPPGSIARFKSGDLELINEGG